MSSSVWPGALQGLLRRIDGSSWLEAHFLCLDER